MRNASQRTHFEILATTKRKGRTNWTRIGTAFPTQNGEGFRLKLDFMPVDPAAELVILPPKRDTADAEEEA